MKISVRKKFKENKREVVPPLALSLKNEKKGKGEGGKGKLRGREEGLCGIDP